MQAGSYDARRSDDEVIAAAHRAHQAILARRRVQAAADRLSVELVLRRRAAEPCLGERRMPKKRPKVEAQEVVTDDIPPPPGEIDILAPY